MYRYLFMAVIFSTLTVNSADLAPRLSNEADGNPVEQVTSHDGVRIVATPRSTGRLKA